MSTTSYEITDIYGNKFICNHSQYDDGTDNETFRIQIGSTRISPACVTIELMKNDIIGYKVNVSDLNTHSKCAEDDDLGTGRQGSQSMLLCGLQMTKMLHPETEEFFLQDNTYLKSHDIALANVYMLTRGSTWYESFLYVIPQLQIATNMVNTFKNKVRSKMDMSYYQVMQEIFHVDHYEADKVTHLKQIWEECYQTCTWYWFLKRISDGYDERFWKNYLKNIMLTVEMNSIKEVMWVGNLSEQKQTLSTIKTLRKIKKFGQIGGNQRGYFGHRGVSYDELLD